MKTFYSQIKTIKSRFICTKFYMAQLPSNFSSVWMKNIFKRKLIHHKKKFRSLRRKF